ncbi:FtsW/RodA/SpoVE family cell cycle protein [Helicobacter kayseriensis]|uniref:FtsW/RodA/SpoVE family cell cycle protein n=1 Tax=Helicobacter kayseriensis TaxID=2905877 RepID=UPI001E3D20B8|nr:FtsW/RodA/SpoVE family cell cycle protein [Helicobacter kayseriensis]MCE3047602.1 FtsW/RodA/SpoVE family cell cycle protein [Helicobacter kayseriensis]MCE3048973.1 FtsW/RodA/SpoVE family cell cycle protein [Helicobacter kayseriensis]
MSKRIFYSVVILISLSIVMVYSLSIYVAMSYGYAPTHFVQRQIIAAIISILLIWAISHFNIDNFLSWFGWFLLIGSFLCILVMPLLPESLASSAGGAKRWIRLAGFSFAPLEFFKIGFVFFLAWSFARKFSHDHSLSTVEEIKKFLPYIVLFMACMGAVVVFQNDFGQAFLLALTMCLMFIYSGGSIKAVSFWFILAIVATLAVIALSPHRILRIKTWWAVAQDFILSIFPSKFADFFRVEDFPEPYQIYHAGNAIWNGGFFGSGVGDGIVKLGFLSEVHTDMILAGISEELGFIGILFLCCLFIWGILHPIFKIANRVENKVYSLFCIGVACLLCFSFLINAFGVTGIIPIKGIAVPFLSYGGSSLMANCIALGLVLGIARKISS